MKRALIAVLVACAIAPASAQAGSSKHCGNGITAGKNTSCQLARGLFMKVGRNVENIADGRRVRVKSPVTGKSYAFFLWQADSRSFTSRAYGNGVLSVRIST